MALVSYPWEVSAQVLVDTILAILAAASGGVYRLVTRDSLGDMTPLEARQQSGGNSISKLST